MERALALHCVRTPATTPAALCHVATTRCEDVPALEAADLDAAAEAAGRDDLWGVLARRPEDFDEAAFDSGLDMDRAVVRRLVDFGVLVDASSLFD